jgi:hypothetical protein
MPAVPVLVFSTQTRWRCSLKLEPEVRLLARLAFQPCSGHLETGLPGLLDSATGLLPCTIRESVVIVVWGACRLAAKPLPVRGMVV